MVKIWELIRRGESGMKWMPERTVRNLMKLMGYYATVLYAVMLLCHAVFRGGFTVRSVIGLASLAGVAAMLAGVGFWVDRKLCLALYSLGLACGLLYMLYVVVFNAAPGWGEAASLLGFTAFAFLGMIAGLGVEYVKYLLKSREKGSEGVE